MKTQLNRDTSFCQQGTDQALKVRSKTPAYFELNFKNETREPNTRPARSGLQIKDTLFHFVHCLQRSNIDQQSVLIKHHFR